MNMPNRSWTNQLVSPTVGLGFNILPSIIGILIVAARSVLIASPDYWLYPGLFFTVVVYNKKAL